MPDFKDNLPIDSLIDDISAGLQRGHVVLASPPGSGKTTRVPLGLLNAPWLKDKKIIMLEPRRPAARMAALRMADQMNEKVGQRVGYQIRFERRIGKDTRIEVLTEGLLTRRLQSDPELKGVGLVVFDEFHERNLASDLGLALCLDICSALRDDLRLMVMSATMDEEKIARMLDAQLIKSDGGLFPVKIHYLPQRPDSDLTLTLSRMVQSARQSCSGDILVFLPGVGEINRLQERLEEQNFNVHVLHGQMSAQNQQAVLCPEPDHHPRIILSTDVAETSLTIIGVTAVVDSGKNRKPSFDPNTGLSRLLTGNISRASARQRAGRAGRLAAGDCFRAWTKDQHQQLCSNIQAEILQAELSPLVLELASWGVTDPAQLSWLDTPPNIAWNQAVNLLRQLQALDAEGRITAQGEAMAKLALHPRLAHMLLAAGSGQRKRAADMAALLSERDVMHYQPGMPRTADLGVRLNALEQFRQKKTVQKHVNRQSLKRVDQLSERLFRQVEKAQGVERYLSDAALLSLAYPERVAARRAGHDGVYLMASGKGVRLPQDDGLAVSDYLTVAHLDAGQRDGRVWLALALQKKELEEVHGAQIVASENLVWDEQRQRVSAVSERYLGQLKISSVNQAVDDEDKAASLLLEKLAQHELKPLLWNAESEQLQFRVRLVLEYCPEQGFPDLSSQWLLTHLQQWLRPWIEGMRSFKDLRKLDLYKVLLGRLDWQQQQILDKLCPLRYRTASGSHYRLDYVGREMPVLSVPMQEMYGIKESPVLMQGKLPVLLELLSPAGRPLQVTNDLANFWSDAYLEVKKEMKGRYPKHHWPDDPANAQPIRLKKNL